MAGGWGAPLMRQQAEFMVLDGAYVKLRLSACRIFG